MSWLRHPSCYALVVMVVCLEAAVGAPPVGSERSSAGATQPAAAPPTRLHALYATLTVTLVLAGALVFGVLVIKQVGHRTVDGDRRRHQTDYVDAWSQYRLPSGESDDVDPDDPDPRA